VSDLEDPEDPEFRKILRLWGIAEGKLYEAEREVARLNKKVAEMSSQIAQLNEAVSERERRIADLRWSIEAQRLG
jgi:predicted  nucleic acid-binding Zn-ribbon protein